MGKPTNNNNLNRRFVLIAAILASSMAFIDGTALNVALPRIQKVFDLDGGQLIWVVNIYLIMLSAFLLPGGSLGDMYGRKNIFILGIILFSLASLFCGFSPTYEFLVVSRTFQGFGAALMVPGSLSLINTVYPASERGKAIGTWSMFSAITTILGPALGGWLASQGLWRFIFFINLPLAAVALYLLFRTTVRQETQKNKQVDYAGALWAALGMGTLSFGFIEAPHFGFSHPLIISLFTASVLFTLLFIYREKRTRQPMMPLEMFRSPVFSGTNAMALLLYAALNGILFFFPLNLIQVQQYSENLAGLALLPFAVVIAAMSRFSGGLVDRFGPRWFMSIGPFLAGVGFLLFGQVGLTSGPESYWTTFFPAAAVMGLGMGFTVTPLTATVMRSVPNEFSGAASGVNNTVTRIAGALAIAIFGAIALISFENSLNDYLSSSQLENSIMQQVSSDASSLAETRVPDELSESRQAKVSEYIKMAFIDTFNRIAILSAILAFSSGLISWFTLKR